MVLDSSVRILSILAFNTVGEMATHSINNTQREKTQQNGRNGNSQYNSTQQLASLS
jgi:hypothetical protein